MDSASVTLIRSTMRGAVCSLAVLLCLPALAAAGTGVGGGASVPGADTAAPPTATDLSGSTGGSAEPSATTPANQDSVVEEAGLLRAPTLLTPLRRPTDPAMTDLAGLATPSAVAAIDGHIVVVRARGRRSELVDLSTGEPRILLSSTRTWGVPNAGRDAAGRPVVIASPCAGVDAVVLQGEAPNCPLRLIDLTDGTSRAVPGSTGALQGDIAGGTIVLVRRSEARGVQLYRSTGGRVQAVATPRLDRAGDGWVPALGKAIRGSVQAGGLDVDTQGRIAVVLAHRANRPKHSAGLFVRDAAGSWRRMISINTTRPQLGIRDVLGPSLSGETVTAYVEGVINGPSFVARWTLAGAQTAKLSVRRSIGRATVLRDAAFDGRQLVFVDWAPELPCGSEGAPACGLRSVGPLPAS